MARRLGQCQFRRVVRAERRNVHPRCHEGRGVDPFLQTGVVAFAGYMLPTETDPMTGPNAFGHTGRGGSLGFADPEHGIAFGYAMNDIIGGPNDVRATSLVEAVRRSLA